jgi:hypothetical protein
VLVIGSTTPTQYPLTSEIGCELYHVNIFTVKALNFLRFASGE